MRTLFTLAPAVCLAATALAQGPQPAKELAPYKALVGHWEGSGTVNPGPGMTLEWTATIDFQPILGGHFYQEDLNVDLGEDMPPYQARTIHGWDSEGGRYIQFGIDSDGSGVLSEMHWAGHVLVGSRTMVDEMSGQVMTTRNTAEVADGKWTIDMRRAVAGGDESAFVQGVMERTAERAQPIDASAVRAGGLSPDLADLRPLVGKWNVTGQVRPPGMDPMDVTATETITPVFGGSALLSHVVGQPGDYQEFYLLWHDGGRIHHAAVNNMGHFLAAEGKVSGDNLVMVHSGTAYGEPIAERYVIEMADGALSKTTAHRFTGTGEAEVSFQATYTRAE